MTAASLPGSRERSRVTWLASFPKSGNTWVRALLRSLSVGGTPNLNRLGSGGFSPQVLATTYGISPTAFSDAEIARLQRAAWRDATRRAGTPLTFKTHEAWIPGADGTPLCWQPEGARSIYIVRDPRAVAVSWAHHVGVSHDRAVEMMRDGAGGPAIVGSIGQNSGQLPWSAHVESWLDQDDLPLMTVRYEDLSKDATGELRRITDWIGLENTAEELAAAVRACEFDRLAASELIGGFVEAASVERSFFRRGEAEAWRTELDPRLAEQVCSDHAQVMARLGYQP